MDDEEKHTPQINGGQLTDEGRQIRHRNPRGGGTGGKSLNR